MPRRPTPDGGDVSSLRSTGRSRLAAVDRAAATRRLANGMRAVHLDAPESPRFAIGMTVRAGARVEPDATAGVAHFLEHVLFRGSARYPEARALAEAFESLGGDWNAATSYESTEFWHAGLVETAPLAIERFAEFLENPRLVDVDVERAVIRRELDGELNEHGHSTDPSLHVARLMWPGCPLARPILGTAETLGAIDRDALAAFRDRHYVPENLVVWTVGGAAEDVSRAVDAAFATHRTGAAGARVPHATPSPFRGPRVVGIPDSDNEYAVEVAFPCGGEWHEDVPALEVLVRVLADGFATRLVGNLRERLGLVYDVDAHTRTFTDVGVLAVTASVREEHLERFFAELYRTLADLRDAGPSVEELVRAVTRANVDALRALDDREELVDDVAWHALHDRTLSLAEEHDRLNAVTRAGVRDLAARTFTAERVAVAMLGPDAPELEDTALAGIEAGL